MKQKATVAVLSSTPQPPRHPERSAAKSKDPDTADITPTVRTFPPQKLENLIPHNHFVILSEADHSLT
jgi:hypothetical protein